ncbi:MAG: hypothetical protein WC766_01315 [Patescibacteria group bacterium]|jgi:hypothetical protein
MSDERSKKFQWISLAYLVLFMLAVFSPSLVRGDVLGLNEAHVEELLIFVFGLSGIAIFIFYERLMEKKEKENKEISDACENAKRELVSSYQYIGSVNRQLEVLKKLVNDTSVSIYDQQKLSKDLLHSLISSASVSYGGGPALLRFVNIEKLRTEREFAHPNNGSKLPFHVSNRDLRAAHDQGTFLKVTADGVPLILVPSDQRNGTIKAFLVVRDARNSESSFDPSVLKVFVNQAELVYRALQRDAEFMAEKAPMEHIEAVTQGVRGSIE